MRIWSAIRRVRLQTVVGGLVVAVGIGGGALVVTQRSELRDQSARLAQVTNCQVEGFQVLVDALGARSAAQGAQIDGIKGQAVEQLRQNDAQLRLLTTPPGSRDDSIAAIQTYKAALESHNKKLHDLIAALDKVTSVRAQTPLLLPNCREPAS